MELLNQKTQVIDVIHDGLNEYESNTNEDLIIRVAENIKAEMIIVYNGMVNVSRKIYLAQSSQLHILYINKADTFVASDEYYLENDAQLRSGYYELNDNDADIKAEVYLNGSATNAEVISSSITDANKKQYYFNCIHNVADTTSLMKNFEISNEGAQYAITASGTIRKGSYHANSRQATRVLTTSDNQSSKVTPLLLIDENDVIASHANSLGQMNSDHLYYLMSRGLSRVQATGLLTLSYLLPLAEVIDDETQKTQLESMIRNKVGL